MRLAHDAEDAPNAERKRALALKAFQAEREAAELLFGALDEEPSRSVLYRSAAVLALECREGREAERLAASGLAGNPPDDIAAELREVLDRTHFQRHLDTTHTELSNDEFEISLVGPAVGTGFANEFAFFSRYRAAQGLFLRTAERLDGQSFAARPRKTTVDRFPFYLSSPADASFAVRVRVGINLSIPGVDYAERVIAEIAECMALYEQRCDRELEARMPKPYRKNFEALAGQLAPDGQNVTLVGFTAGPKENGKHVAVTRRGLAIPESPIDTALLDQTLEAGRLTVRGVLAFASSVGGKSVRHIKIETAEGKTYLVVVPAEIMHDVVRHYYEEEVVATLRLQRRGGYQLISVMPG
jgi:hypothetical protein